MPLFTDDDRGKPVENADGETVGTIESVEGDVAHVRPNPDVVDSVKSSIGWDSRVDESLPLDGDAVSDVTDEAVRLEGPLLEQTGASADRAESASGDTETGDDSRTDPAGGMSGLDETDVSEEMRDDESTVGDDGSESDVDEADRGLEADPAELTDDASGMEVHPDDVNERTDAAVDPDDDTERTDAEMEPSTEDRDGDADDGR